MGLTFEFCLISEELFLILLTALRHGAKQLGVLLVLSAEERATH